MERIARARGERGRGNISTRAAKSRVQRVVARPQGQGSLAQQHLGQIAPGSVLSKAIDRAKGSIDWGKMASDVSSLDASSSAVAKSPALGLVLGELGLADGDAERLASKVRATEDYGSFALQRTLGMKAVITLGATRGGVTDAKTRCAIGRVISDSSSEDSLFAVFARRASKDLDAFVSGVSEDLQRIASESLSSEDLDRTKNWYAASVSPAHFSFVQNQVRRACSSSNADTKNVKVVPVLIPVYDGKSTRGTFGGALDGADDDEDDDDGFMFGKKSKKKKKAKSTSAAVSSTSSEPQTVSDLLTKMVSQRVGSQREPTFPELEMSWGQTTAAEVGGAVLQLVAEAPAKSVVILPSELIRATISFDADASGVNAAGARAVSIEQVASDASVIGDDVSSTLWVTFDPDDASKSAETFKRALENIRSRNIPIVNAVFALVPEIESCDAETGPADAVSLAASVSSRAHAAFVSDDDE